MPQWDTLWIDVHLATMQGTGLGVVRDGALATVGDRIAWLGAASELSAPPDQLTRDVMRGGGAWILPGFIDCHTHIVFGGDRSGEFRQRLHGATYEEIAKAGGGIASTMRATREASDEELLRGALQRAGDLMAWGVTTVEIKSGYGLDLTTELRMLQVARTLGSLLPLDVHTTLLAAHALPPEFVGRQSDYVDHVVGAILPAAVEEGLADGIDAFCELIAFTPDEAGRVLRAGIRAGLVGRLHADQLSDMGGGEVAASVGARSADHVEHLSATGVDAMAAAGVAAVLLPGAYYTLGGGQKPPIEQLRRAGVALAVATDSNPGSSPLTHVGAVLNMACVLFGLTPEEALRGMTSAAAGVLDQGDERGALAPGLVADLAVWSVPDPVWLTYWVGQPPLKALIKSGVRVRVPVGAPEARG